MTAARRHTRVCGEARSARIVGRPLWPASTPIAGYVWAQTSPEPLERLLVEMWKQTRRGRFGRSPLLEAEAGGVETVAQFMALM